MNSLQDLNNYGKTAIEYEDNRPAGVIFDVDPSLITQKQFTAALGGVLVEPPINIIEVVNYDVSNPRYRVEIVNIGDPALGASTISWPTLPSGVYVEIVGDQYTVFGIYNPLLWEQISTFQLNLPSDFTDAEGWYLAVSIIYYDEELEREITVDWDAFDPLYYFFAKLGGITTLSSSGLRIRRSSITMSSSFLLDCEQGIEKRITATLVSAFGIQVSGDDARLANANLEASTSLAIIPTVVKRTTVTLVPNFFLNASSVVSAFLYNKGDRTWLSNQPNLIFASPNNPYVIDPEGVNYTLTLTASSGLFESANGITGQSIGVGLTGNEAFNNFIQGVKYYPVKNSTSNVTYTLDLIKGTSPFIRFIFTYNLNYAGAGTTPTILEGFGTSSTSTWNPTLTQQLYHQMDYLIVGGGGGGGLGYLGTGGGWPSPYGGGGGGGQVLLELNRPITSSTYNVIQGAGGSKGVPQGTIQGISPLPNSYNGLPGGNSSFDGITALGGQGGGKGLIVSGTPQGGKGGNSGSGFVGATGTNIKGGNGAGANENGGLPGLSTPLPNGVFNSLSGQNIEYGQGGEGGQSFSNGGPGDRALTSGSGGGGQGITSPTTAANTEGQRGLVIIKTHP